MAGAILNKPNDITTQEATDSFLEGWAVSASGSYGVIAYGASLPLNEKTLSTETMIGVETGLIIGPKKTKANMIPSVTFSKGEGANSEEEEKEFTVFEAIRSVSK